MPAAVTSALRERLQRERRWRDAATVAQRLVDIGKAYSQLPDADTRTADAILGYDENGLPT